MPRVRKPIDDLIDALLWMRSEAKNRLRRDRLPDDAHVWMRHQEAGLNRRPLTLDGVPDELLAEFGLRRGGATLPSYRWADAAAVLVPLADITGPLQRKLNEESVRSLLRGIRDGADLPPVVVFREPGAQTAALLDGLHRVRVSIALGFVAIPALMISRDAAELGYRYGQP
jgi:hypothetical protein